MKEKGNLSNGNQSVVENHIKSYMYMVVFASDQCLTVSFSNTGTTFSILTSYMYHNRAAYSNIALHETFP